MIRIPGTDLSLRLFDRVPTDTNNFDYDVFDIGVVHADGGIDSIAFGGSFYSAKKVIDTMNDKADAKASDTSAPSASAAWAHSPPYGGFISLCSLSL